jgi:multidrug efflux system outer membrane protein
VSLQTGYEVDLWGKLSSSRSAARHQYLASAWGRAAMEWTLTAQVAEAYFSLAMVDRQIDISQAMRASRETTLRLRQREHEVGAGNEFDLRRAEAEVASTDSTLISLARQRVSLDRTLMLLLGRNPSQIVAGKLERRMLDERKESIPVLPQGDVNEFLLRRPDIKQAEAQLAASNANIEAARAAALPALRLTGAIGSDAKSVSDLFSAPAAIWSLAASLTQSIFDGGQAEARIRGEHARAEQSLASYRKTIATAVLDVREAYATLDLTQQAYRAEHTRVASLGRAREIAKAGYDAGALNYLDLLDAERNLYQAQLQKVTATRDQLVGQVAAFKALGGGYAPQPQTLAQK